MITKRKKPHRKFPSSEDFQQLLSTLLSRRLWFLGTFLSVLSVCAFVTIKTKPTYQSRLQILVEPSHSTTKWENDYATQLTLLGSSELVNQALALLKVEYSHLDLATMQEHLTIEQIVADQVSTRIFQVRYSDDEPVKTQKVLQALSKVYQNYTQKQNQLALATPEPMAPQESQPPQNAIAVDYEATTNFARTFHTLEQEQSSLRVQYQATLSLYNVLRQQLGILDQDNALNSQLNQSPGYRGLLKNLQTTELAIAQHQSKTENNASKLSELTQKRQRQYQLLQKELTRVQKTLPSQGASGGKPWQAEQLSATHNSFSQQLTNVQIELLMLRAREQILAHTAKQLRSQLDVATPQETAPQTAPHQLRWQVVEMPQRGKQIAPQPGVNFALSTIIGLVLGSAAALMRESLDDTIHTPEELPQNLGVPLLGTIPQIPQVKLSNPWLRIPLLKPKTTAPEIWQTIHWQPFRDSVAWIYQNLQLSDSTRQLKSVAVTSATNGEGKSTLALGLALSAARFNRRVLLIDANLHQPRLHKYLNLPNEQGLSTLLENDIILPLLNRPVPLPHVWLSTLTSADDTSRGSHSPLGANVDVLTTGAVPKDPIKLLSSPRMKELMATFEHSYDLVILDTPSVLSTVDAIKTASICHGVVMVGRMEQVTQSQFKHALAALNRLNLIGSVANGAINSPKNYLPTNCQRPNQSRQRVTGVA